MLYAGLCSISFRSKTAEQIISAAVAAGLQCIEWGSDVHAPCHGTARLEEIAKLQKEAGLFCSSYGTYYHIGKDTPEMLYAYIKGAKILGTNILRLWTGSKASAKYTPEELEEFYAHSRTLAKIAEEQDVILCMECHADTLTDTAESAYALMQAVNSPAFRMYFQPHQLRTLEENCAYARLLAPYVYNLHVFNWSSAGRHLLRDGIEQWRAYLRCFTGTHALLLEYLPDDRIESLPEEAKALLQIIGA